MTSATAEPAGQDAKRKDSEIIDPGGARADCDPPKTAGGAEALPHRESGDCSSGESNTRAKRDRSASACVTHYKDGSGGGGCGGSGNGSGGGDSRSGSGGEDAAQTSAQPQRAPPIGKVGKGGKHKLARPEGTATCPRCSSPNTKFCYYNNYNIKQPRYFCKDCQRYWTAGGILRNVPVGAGRRKSKASAVREQEKAAAAVAAKQARQVAAHGGASGQAAGANGASGPGMPGGIDTGQQPQLMSAAGDLLPAGPMGGGPAPGFGADQLRFMMDPCAQLAAGGMGGPGGMMGGPSGAMMGGPGGMGPMSFDAPAGYGGGFGPGAGMMLPPHAAGGMGGMRMGGDGGGMLPSGSGGTLATESAVLSGPVGSGFSGAAAEDGGRADGRRVRAKLDGGHGGSMGGGHGGGIPPSNSAGSLGKGLPGGSAGGGDDRHPEWAAAAQAAERQQAAALAAQMAAQASMQQAAAMQAQAQLQGMAAAAQWGQPAAPFGMPGTGMWPSYPAMAAPSYGVSPNWAAAAQLNARFGNNGFGGNMSSSGDPSGGSGAMKSPTMAVGAPGDAAGGDMNGAPGMMGGGGWNGMMPTGSAPMNFNPGWGMGGDMGGGWGGLPGVPHMSMPAGKHMGSMSGGGGPAGSSLASGQSANTGLQAPSAAV